MEGLFILRKTVFMKVMTRGNAGWEVSALCYSHHRASECCCSQGHFQFSLLTSHSWRPGHTLQPSVDRIILWACCSSETLEYFILIEEKL